jgi:hypothetical protein
MTTNLPLNYLASICNTSENFAAILKAAGCIIEVNRSVTEKGKAGISGGLEATIKVPFPRFIGKGIIAYFCCPLCVGRAAGFPFNFSYQ